MQTFSEILTLANMEAFNKIHTFPNILPIVKRQICVKKRIFSTKKTFAKI